MKRNALVAMLIAFALSLSLTGCTAGDGGSGADAQQPAASSEQPASLDEVIGDDFQNAYYLLATAIPEESTMQSLYIVGDEENKVIRGTFTSMSDGTDKAALTAEVEQLLKSYSDKTFEAAKSRAEEAGDEEAVEKWQALIDEEAEAEDAGALYDSYKAIITISNSDGTVKIEGDREAGADSAFNWQ